MFKVLHILLSSVPCSPITDSSDSTSSRAATCIFIHNFNRLEEPDPHCHSVRTSEGQREPRKQFSCSCGGSARALPLKNHAKALSTHRIAASSMYLAATAESSHLLCTGGCWRSQGHGHSLLKTEERLNCSKYI